MDRTKELTSFVESELAKGRKSNIQPDDDLLSEGVIDSLGILQLVSFVEDKFNIQIDDEDVVLENFQSIAALNNFLSSK